jgi:hypothetical protein
MQCYDNNSASIPAQEQALDSAAKKRIGIRVVANYRLKQFEVWAIVCGWRERGLPKGRRRWNFLRFLADHAWLAVSGDREASVRRHCLKWAPKLTEAELDELITGAGDARLWRSDDCARLLGISAAAREKHRLTHLGADDDPDRVKRKAYAAARRKERDRLRKAAARKAAGVTSRAEYLASHSENRSKPWIALNKSRRTYFRDKARAKQIGTGVSPDNIAPAPYERTDVCHAPDGFDERGSHKAIPAAHSTASQAEPEQRRPILYGEILLPGEDDEGSATLGASPTPSYDRAYVLRMAQAYERGGLLEMSRESHR